MNNWENDIERLKSQLQKESEIRELIDDIRASCDRSEKTDKEYQDLLKSQKRDRIIIYTLLVLAFAVLGLMVKQL